MRYVSIDVSGETFNIGYDSRIAVQQYASIRPVIDATQDDWDKIDLIIEWLAACIVIWDYFTDASMTTLVPISVKSINGLSLRLIEKITKAIAEDLANLTR